jgi:NRAMP (natural resistance-associated macrophage protein)-like metal ion transporter
MSTADLPTHRRGRLGEWPGWLKTLLGLVAIFGPGLIAANAGNDAGGIVTYASAGAQFGYRTLFLMLVVTVALVVVQEMCSRLGAYTGQGLGALIREQFPLRWGLAAIALLYLANVGLTVSEFAGIGGAMEIFGVSRYLALPLALVSIWTVTAIGSYSSAQRVFLVMGLVFLVYPIAALIGHPSTRAVFTNLLSPHFAHSKAFLFLAVALIGTTITPYMQFYLTAAVVDRGVTPNTYRAERVDAVSGAILSNAVAIFIIVATATAIGGSGALNSVGQASAALRPVAGVAASQLFAIGLLGASLLAATVVPLSTAYAIAETIGRERSLSRKLREAPLFYRIYTVQLLIGAGVALLPGNAVSLMINAQVLNGFITPILLTLILILANRRAVLGEAVNGPVFRSVATICVALIGVLSAVVLVQTLAGWL